MTDHPHPTRAALEQLLSQLARGYVESLEPMGRVMVQSLSRARGWDLDHLASGRGPLAPVSDQALVVLVSAFADELNATLSAHALADGFSRYSEPELDAAMRELKAALA